MYRLYAKHTLLVLIILLVLTACGGDEPSSSSATAESSFQLDLAPTAAPPIKPTTAVPSTTTNQPVNSLEDVRSATVRVAFEGSFLHYDYGEVINLPNHGSGFIISPDGTAVTNNHVVTGAAFLEIWLEGEKQPRNAKVLGVSECADLAVIDIDGDGFPYLDWYAGPINTGMDIYAAGYPLYGNEEYTLTRGIISKEQADGETNWASIDSVIEIDANIQGGNSGGPLVTKDAQVVAVNYAGNNETRQNFSISRDVAIGLVEQLRSGQNVHSIGVNGEAIGLENGLTGIWVSSVSSGSPANRAGVKPGDIITHLEGLALASDGTLADYCDILRSHDADDPLTIEVYRYLTDETLTGQLNEN